MMSRQSLTIPAVSKEANGIFDGHTRNSYVAAQNAQFYTRERKPGNMRFCPGYDSAPTMSGQSTILRGFDAPNDTDGRCCTYSLLGIFNISNPVIYGEGDCTVGRLHSMNHPSSTLTTFLLFHLGELVSTSEPAPLTMMDVYDGASNAARSRVLVRDCPQDDTSAAMLSRCRI